MRALVWLGGALAFVAFGYAVSSMLANMGGWRLLAQAYPLRAPFPSARRSFVGARVGSVNYHGCLHVSADAAGLYIAVLALFRAAHPPLFIPWRDIAASHSTSPYGPMIRLRTRAVPASAIELPLGVAGWVKQQAGLSAWPGDVKSIN